MEPLDTRAARRVRRRRQRRTLGALQTRSEPTRAFVADFVPGTYDQGEVVRAALADIPIANPKAASKAERFLIHVLTAAGREGDPYVPVPSKLIEKEWRGLDWRSILEAGVVGVRPYNRLARRSREFAVTPRVAFDFYEAGPTAERVVQDGLYDLTTGRPTTRRVKSDRRTPSGNAWPAMIRAAIDAVGEVPVDVVRIEREHLPQLRALMNGAEPGPDRVSAEGRYLNDLRCLQAVLTQGARPLDPEDPDGLWVYRPAYRPQRFGRLSQKGGGLQSCSKEMKDVAYPETYPLP